MNKIKFLWILCVIVFPFNKTKAQTNEAAINAKINALVKKMTLEEKVGQMAQVSIESLGKIEGDNFVFDQGKLKDAVQNYKIGSILNSPGIPLKAAQWNAVIQQIQNAANETKNKIPVLYGLDDNHGCNYVLDATLFPQQIGQSATWNPQLIFNAGVITAYESRAASVP
ncbi:MAG: glycoside hydrolase family 3 N-terminal domain-containing protein, partial [Ginsengibacter sp.]